MISSMQESLRLSDHVTDLYKGMLESTAKDEEPTFVCTLTGKTIDTMLRCEPNWRCTRCNTPLLSEEQLNKAMIIRDPREW